MNILFLGTPKSAIPILEKLTQSKHHLIAAVTQKAKPKGRNKVITKTDVASYCLENTINVYETDDINETYEKFLSKLDIDLALVVAFGQIIPSSLLNKFRFGWINLHYSLLPDLKGAAPIQWAILNNQNETGYTWFQIDQGLDSGEILFQEKLSIKGETYPELMNKINTLAVNKLDEFLLDLENERIVKRKQTGKSSWAPKLQEKDLKINWNEDYIKTTSIIRISNEYQCSWTCLENEKIKINSYEEISELALQPGEISIQKKKVLVGTGTKSIVLGEVTPQGKKKMLAFDWINGIQNKDNLLFQ